MRLSGLYTIPFMSCDLLVDHCEDLKKIMKLYCKHNLTIVFL